MNLKERLDEESKGIDLTHWDEITRAGDGRRAYIKTNDGNYVTVGEMIDHMSIDIIKEYYSTPKEDIDQEWFRFRADIIKDLASAQVDWRPFYN